MSDLSRMTLKELGKLLLYTMCWLAMLQFTLQSLLHGEYIDMCIEALGTIGWTIIYWKYQKELRDKYKSPTPASPKGEEPQSCKGEG